ncbi:MAG: allantoinase, partial [Sulfobacillus benefaciens]
MDVILKQAQIPQGNRRVRADILVADGKIAGYVNDSTGVVAKTTIDCQGYLVLPGAI